MNKRVVNENSKSIVNVYYDKNFMDVKLWYFDFIT